MTNMVSDIDGKELNLGWNSQYQLTSVDVLATPETGTAAAGVLYDYNVLGQRVSRKEIIGSDLSADRQANTEYYVHDGVNIVADLDEDKSLLRSYTYAPGYDNIISMTTYGENETNTYFYIRNHNNSVVALIDENGEVAERYEYSAYGEITVLDSNGNELDESALGNRYTFQGREIDWSTGFYNFRARWYEPETGRWLSKDPIGINGGLNQYVFCGNNPVMFVDPEGELWFTIPALIMIGLIASVVVGAIAVINLLDKAAATPMNEAIKAIDDPDSDPSENAENAKDSIIDGLQETGNPPFIPLSEYIEAIEDKVDDHYQKKDKNK